MNPKNPNTEMNRLWKDLTEEFRRACLLRRQGDQEEASNILNQDLPMLISKWSQASPSTDAMKREQLKQMFDRERERIEDAWLMQQLILRQMRDVLIPSLCLQVAEEVREVMETQVGEITRKIATLERPPTDHLMPGNVLVSSGAQSSRSVQPVLSAKLSASDPVDRIVAMPGNAKRVEPQRPRPSFDDLPAIIDELISGERGYDFSNQRAFVLV